MKKALSLLQSIVTSLSHGSFSNDELEKIFANSEDFDQAGSISSTSLSLRNSIQECHEVLELLRKEFSLPNYFFKPSIGEFCLAHARLIFCTASSSAKLNEGNTPVDLLVIDEAAQLKECESAIPLQLPWVRHAILIGDERQLPAMVKSKLSEKAGFGMSLFERLVSLGHKKHLLNIQYRMHPSISLFPNTEFYGKKILDAQNVNEESYKKDLLQGNMYGSYSIINVSYGKEEFDDAFSKRNMTEVYVVSDMVAKLHQGTNFFY
ncbi:hypothetical protein ACHQM5_006408 [Ranunculus cassubicifolius]